MSSSAVGAVRPRSNDRSVVPGKEFVLYRFYDEKRHLLYVGRSVSFAARLRGHRATQAWWPEVSVVTLVRFETGEELEQQEQWTIRSERPKYNVQHNSGYSLPSNVAPHKPPPVPPRAVTKTCGACGRDADLDAEDTADFDRRFGPGDYSGPYALIADGWRRPHIAVAPQGGVERWFTEHTGGDLVYLTDAEARPLLAIGAVCEWEFYRPNGGQAPASPTSPKAD